MPNLGPEIGPQGRLLETDAATNKGASGSPIVTEDGEVAAITTLQGNGEDQGYGIQADVVRSALPGLIDGESGTGLQTIPVRSLPMADIIFGLYHDQGVTPALARYLAAQVYDKGGLLVVGTKPGSSADRRGFKLGDVVVRMNGLVVNNQTKHCHVLGSADVVKMEGYRLAGGISSLLGLHDFTRRVTVE